jgi:S1-C subfamily serine protease
MKSTRALLIALLAIILISQPLAAAEKAFLGVVPDRSVSVETAEYTGTGLRLSKVISDGPADQAGLRAGDVLTHFAGKPIHDGDDLSFFLKKATPGESVEIRWEHSGDMRTGKVALSSREDDSQNVRIEILGKDVASLSFDNRAFLGVSTISINSNLLEYFGVKAGHGILVDAVVDGSAARRAGLEVGDVLVALDGNAIDSPGRLRRLIQDYEPGTSVKLTIVRDRAEFVLPVELGDRDTSSLEPELNPRHLPAMPAMPAIPVLPHSTDKDARVSMPGMKAVSRTATLLTDLFGSPLAMAIKK